jgi:hypothetical protein
MCIAVTFFGMVVTDTPSKNCVTTCNEGTPIASASAVSGAFKAVMPPLDRVHAILHIETRSGNGSNVVSFQSELHCKQRA